MDIDYSYHDAGYGEYDPAYDVTIARIDGYKSYVEANPFNGVLFLIHPDDPTEVVNALAGVAEEYDPDYEIELV